jgi:peptidoglycan-N-acetylglucosamine deacetylase
VQHPRLSVSFGLSFDAMCLWISRGAGATEVSRGEVAATTIPRILAVFERTQVRATFFVPGHTALAYPHLVRAIRDAGHEVAHHGWVHENAGAGDLAGERAHFEHGFTALQHAAGVRPIGYRATGNDYEFSESSIALMREFGFVYDSSCFGNDYYPYYLREGDERPPDGPFIFGRATDIVEVPCCWVLDDFNMFEFVPGYSARQAPTDEVERIWREEFDYAYEEAPGGVFNYMLHDQAIGRGPRLRMLERLIGYMKSRDGVVFEPLSDYVQRWKQANPRSAWLASRPANAGLDAIRLDGRSASKELADAT